MASADENLRRFHEGLAHLKRLELCDFYTYFPDTGPHRRALYKRHMEFFASGAEFSQRLFCAANRIGKALQHGTRVATPAGWRAIETLSVGDVVIAGDGTPTAVTGVFPQGEVPLYGVTVDGHHTVAACAEHQWLFLPPRGRYRRRHSHGRWEPNPSHGKWTVGNTAALATAIGRGARQRPLLPVAQPFVLPRQTSAALPMDPYVLGVLLGDGGLSRQSVVLSSADADIIASVRRHYPVRRYSRYDYGVKGARSAIVALGLAGKRSEQKHVPAPYLYADATTRLAVLQGLMDTDGSITPTSGAMEFSTTSDDLADGFEWLAVSLGMKVRRERRQTHSQNGPGLPSWRLWLRSPRLCPFRLARKAVRWRPLRETGDWVVHDVRGLGHGEATCISVAHDSATFVIEHGIVTHNTKAGAFEVVCHLTGEYPDWWEGRRFDHPGEWWVCGKDWGTVRDIVQTALVGPVTTDGKLQGGGMLPFDKIHHYTRRPHGLPGGLDTIWVKHRAGGYAVAQFKAYEQSRKSFEGTAKQGVWDDEEPPEDVYTEQLYRTATTGGIMLVTFTPLEGMSRVVMGFVQPDDEEAKKYKRLINAGWDDVPHLDPASKAALLATTPPFQRDARTKGIPQLGSGAVYGFPESELVIPTMAIPPHWVHCAGADAGGGAKPTAAAWLAADPRVGGQVQVYDTYKRESPEVAIHLAAMKAKGDWIPFFMDAAALIVTEHDAEQLVNLYRRGGLMVELPNKAVETGIQQVWELISAGRFKVQAHCVDWLKEFRMYQRDEHGRIVKRDDHLMDATRYGVISGLARAKPRPAPKAARRGPLPGQGGDSWMQ